MSEIATYPIEKNIVFHGCLSELYDLAKLGKIKTGLQGMHTRPCKFCTDRKGVVRGKRGSVGGRRR